jgi:hypothetical protein
MIIGGLEGVFRGWLGGHGMGIREDGGIWDAGLNYGAGSNLLKNHSHFILEK